MTKRVYSESVKKWAKGAGITSGTLIGLTFMYLFAIGAISNVSYSGDMVCAGTIEDPCYAFINFTANEDIFIYPFEGVPDPWGRDTLFSFDPNVKSWKLERSWGDGWREIPLNKSCTGTWCGLSNSEDERKFSVAFREGKNYSLRITAYKNNPSDTIKWGAFSGVDGIDPYWLGEEATEIFYEDFENDWETTATSTCDSSPDPNSIGNFNAADSESNDLLWCATSEVNRAHEGTYGLNLEDWDGGALTDETGIWYYFDASTACNGGECGDINVNFWAWESGMDAGDYCWITEQIEDGTPDNITVIAQPVDTYTKYSANLSSGALSSNNVSVRIMCYMTSVADETYIDEFNITGYIDVVGPTYSLNQTNNTLTGESTLFSLYVDDNVALETNGYFIFSTNNTGRWVNGSKDWLPDSTVNNSLPTYGVSSIGTFYIGNQLYGIYGMASGWLMGYNWTGSSWQSDPNINASLSSTGEDSDPDIFYIGDTLNLISSDYEGNLFGYTWNGTDWNTNDTVINGMIELEDQTLRSNTFDYDGETYSIVGRYTGGWYGYVWNGTGWDINSTIITGLTDVGLYSNPAIFERDDIYYLISGNYVGDFFGWRLDGYTWVNDTSIIDGLTTIDGTFLNAPEVFTIGDNYYMIYGTQGNDTFGYNLTYSENFSSTPDWANVTRTLNSSSGISVGYRWYLFDNEGNSNVTETFSLITTGEDTCTYSSGNWEVDCSDNCVIDSVVDLSDNNLTLSNSSGIGNFTIEANITNFDKIIKDNNCQIIFNGGKLVK